MLSLQNLVPGQPCPCVLRDGRTPKAELPPPPPTSCVRLWAGFNSGPVSLDIPFTFSTSVCASVKWTGGPTHRTYYEGNRLCCVVLIISEPPKAKVRAARCERDTSHSPAHASKRCRGCPQPFRKGAALIVSHAGTSSPTSACLTDIPKGVQVGSHTREAAVGWAGRSYAGQAGERTRGCWLLEGGHGGQ